MGVVCSYIKCGRFAYYFYVVKSITPNQKRKLIFEIILYNILYTRMYLLCYVHVCMYCIIYTYVSTVCYTRMYVLYVMH